MEILRRKSREVITDEFAQRVRSVGSQIPDETPLVGLYHGHWYWTDAFPLDELLGNELAEKWRSVSRDGEERKAISFAFRSFPHSLKKKDKSLTTVGDVRQATLEELSEGKPPGLRIQLLNIIFRRD